MISFIEPLVQEITIFSILNEMNCFANWPEEGYDEILGYGCLRVKLISYSPRRTQRNRLFFFFVLFVLFVVNSVTSFLKRLEISKEKA